MFVSYMLKSCVWWLFETSEIYPTFLRDAQILTTASVRRFKTTSCLLSLCSNPAYRLGLRLKKFTLFAFEMFKSRALLLLGLHGLIVFIAGILKFCAWLRA